MVPKEIMGLKTFKAPKIWVQKKFAPPPKILGLNISGKKSPKKFGLRKKVMSEITLIQKNIKDQKKFWSQKCLVQKSLVKRSLVQRNVMYNNKGPKKWGP